MNRIICLGYFLSFYLFLGPGFAQGMGDLEKIQRIENEYEEVKKSFPALPEMSPREFQKIQREQNVILLDVRKRKEQKVSIIPKALTKKEFNKEKEKFKHHKIVVYCTIGDRSGRYGEKLEKMGFEAYNLKGGILLWVFFKGTLINEKGPTKRVHVYGKEWNILPEGYEPVW